MKTGTQQRQVTKDDQADNATGVFASTSSALVVSVLTTNIVR